MTELEHLLTEALASQSEHVASLAERLNDLTELLLATRAQQERLEPAGLPDGSGDGGRLTPRLPDRILARQTWRAIVTILRGRGDAATSLASPPTPGHPGVQRNAGADRRWAADDHVIASVPPPRR